MEKDYEKVRAQILDKRMMTKEDRFVLGENSIDVLIDTLPERGKIRSYKDIFAIRTKVQEKMYSIVDVMKEYHLKSRDVVYKIMGFDNLIFAPSVGARLRVQKPINLVAEIIRAYDGETPTYIIAKRHGLSQEKVRKILRDNNVEMSRSKKRLPRLSIQEKEAIDLWRSKGLSPKEISQKLDFDEGQVRRYIKNVFGK